MKFDRSNKFDICYYGQVNLLRLKSSVASKWARKHLWGNNYFAVNGTIIECAGNTYVISSVWRLLLEPRALRMLASSDLSLLSLMDKLCSTQSSSWQRKQRLNHKLAYSSRIHYLTQLVSLTLFLLAVPNATVWQKILFQFKKGSTKISYKRRDYESVDEKSIS